MNDYPPLRTRLQYIVDVIGIRINKIAENSGVDPQKLYNLRSGVQKTLNEPDAINLHEYFKKYEQNTNSSTEPQL